MLSGSDYKEILFAIAPEGAPTGYGVGGSFDVGAASATILL